MYYVIFTRFMKYFSTARENPDKGEDVKGQKTLRSKRLPDMPGGRLSF